MIYLNNGSRTLIKPESVEAAAPCSKADAKKKLAAFFGLDKGDNFFFTQGGSQAMALALQVFIRPGDHVIASVVETDSTCKVLEDLRLERGIEISYVGVNAYGKLNIDEIPGLIGPNTRILVCAHGCGVTGNITDMEKVTAIARRYGLKVITDGSQTVGATPVSLKDLGVDVYCFDTGKRLMGPDRLGGLWIKHNLPEQMELAAMVNNQDIDEKKLGQLAGALDFIAEKGIYGICMQPHRLAKRFFESVSSMDRVTVYGDFGTSTRVPTVTVNFEGVTTKEAQAHLTRKYGIVVNGGFQNGRMLHRALGTSDGGLVRFSFGYFNTRRDVNDTIWAIMDMLGLEDLYLLS